MISIGVLVFLLSLGIALSERISFDDVVVELGNNLGSRVRHQVKELLRRIVNVSYNFQNSTHRNITGKHLLLSFGNTRSSEGVISQDSLNSLPPESIRIVSFQNKSNSFFLTCNGNPLNEATHKNVSFNKLAVHYGALVATYSCLELLGFGFFHPLQTYVPSILSLDIPSECFHSERHQACVVANITESPHWPERGFHIHTQHPLEVTEVLQGHDIPQFGPHGAYCTKTKSFVTPSDENSSNRKTSHDPNNNVKVSYCERWEDMVPDVNSLFQWCVANRINKLEWLMLGNYKWGDELETRKQRLKLLTSLGHDYSLLIGADIPIGNTQQHAWSMVNTRLPYKKQAQQIRDRVDWILSAGFDFLTTESGLTEFSHPECALMLALMNEFADYVNGSWGREAAIKVHCSTGQTCEAYPDPATGDPINFNFLPTFASSRMGVFPHTVQVYALDDPTAGAYDNDNFSYIEEYMIAEAKRGNRSVQYYGETAYWVNVDIDVPLFLPLYGQRRLHDLRRIAGREIREGFRIDGQMNFDSGWEWGYWISDVVTARAAWNPLLSSHVLLHSGDNKDACTNDNDISSGACSEGAGYRETDDQWEAFSISLRPITAIFEPNLGRRLNDLLVRLTQSQAELLIYGNIDEKPNPDVASHKLTGMAYLSGDDTWIDLPRLFGLLLLQPDKVHLREMDGATDVEDVRDDEVRPTRVEVDVDVDGDAMSTPSSDDDKQGSGGAETRQKSKRHLPKHALRLLSAMVKQFTAFSEEMRNILSDAEKMTSDPIAPYPINEGALSILREIDDSVRLLSLRATHVTLLYLSRSSESVRQEMISTEFSDNSSSSVSSSVPALITPLNPAPPPTTTTSPPPPPNIPAKYLPRASSSRASLQQQSRAIILDAAEVVQRRESYYRVPWQRIAAWRENPTVYRYGYLWAVHSLYYWWRDQGLAEEGSLQSELSPCYLNRMDISEMAVGWGKYSLELVRTAINNYSPFSSGYPLELVNCFAPPAKEYVFPRDLYPLE